MNICNILNVISHNYNPKQSTFFCIPQSIYQEFWGVATLADPIRTFVVMMMMMMKM